MKNTQKIIICLILMIFCSPLIQAQNNTSTSDYDEVFPTKYTFEKAAEFEKKGEYDKAIWFYINLFSDNKEKVISKVKQLKKPDTLSLKKFIEYSFGSYSIFDPTISAMKNGEMQIDKDKLEAKGAIGDYLIACVVDPNDTLLSAYQLSCRAKEECDKNDYISAIRDYSCAIHLDPLPGYYFFRAYAKSAIEKYTEALPDYAQCITMKYKLMETYFERGYAYAALGMYEEAIKDFTASIEIEDDHKMTYNNRGDCYYYINDYKKAIADYDKTLKLDPSAVGAYISRGLSKIKLDDKKGACKDWDKAIELGNQRAQELKNKYCN
jgi:hypothetical protein